MSDYDNQNIFAKILRGEIPSFKVYEDDETLCFMDIMPRTDGHCLVIPKTPCRNMLDATPAQLAACMATVNKVSNAAKRAFEADTMNEMSLRINPEARKNRARRKSVCLRLESDPFCLIKLHDPAWPLGCLGKNTDNKMRASRWLTLS